MRRSLRLAGRIEGYLPLFNFMHRDNARMITVGGMVGDHGQLGILGDCVRRLKVAMPYIATSELQRISVPPLTARERSELDRMLPTASPAEIKNAFAARFSDQAIESYLRYYRHFPAYAEMLVG